MNWPPPLERLKAVVSYAVPRVTVRSLDPLPPATADGLQLLFDVRLSDDRVLLLKLPPSSLKRRLMRWEDGLASSEPCVIAWIFTKILECPLAQTPGTPMHSFVTPNTQTGFSPFKATNMISMNRESSSASPGDTLLSYLPALVKSSSSNKEPDFPFSLWEPTVGSSISSLTEPLTPPERRMVEYQKGYLVRHISQFRARNSRFGPAAAVLGCAPSRSGANMEGNGGLPMPPPSGGLDGFATWSVAFHALVEDIIRDGEDLTVMLDYTRIREQTARLSYALDNVMESRLVLLDAGSDGNVLVTRYTKAARLEEESTRAICTKDGNPQARPSLTSRLSCNSQKEGATFDNVKRVGEVVGTQRVVDATEAARISVTGFLDWSNCIFGDPLMVKVCSRNPSDDFLRGFRGQPPDPSSSFNAEMARDIPSSKKSLPPTPMNTPESVSPLTTTSMLPTTRFHMMPSSSCPPRRTMLPGRATADRLPGQEKAPGDSAERVKDRNTNADEEDSSAAIRLLLYECYHAIVCVIKTFYRTCPPEESKEREMAARMHLTEVLHKLSQIQPEPVGNSRDNSNSGRSGGSGSSGGDGKWFKSRRASGDDDDEPDGWPIKRRKSEVG
ncbi:hypothetical protein PG993_004861 [Apiospora rasikravindrae]|uniref:Uncharacterized protein n=1 Tax=Apiospora rasikravindrae TaxID=990691 RepID=A0ABR1TE01_9PEZI